MTTIPANGLVLVTGVTGYIAAWCAKDLLEKGFRVRGTARTPSKAEYLKKEVFATYGDKFEIVTVEDLQKPGAFDEAVKGVDGIAHVASPFHFNVEDPFKDLIEPAVNGTKSLLHAAKKFAGPQLKHVVVTSSFAACAEPHDAGYVYTENDWNDFSIKACKEKGKGVDPSNAYRASKSEAERAVWAFQKDESPSFALSTVNPTFVFGPFIHSIEKPDSINTSVALLFKYMNGTQKEVAAPAPSQAFVDVRDVAKAHTLCLTKPESAGKRFLCTTAGFAWQEIVDLLRKNFPELKDKIPEGKPGQGYGTPNRVDNSRARDVLGIEFIPLEQTVVDTAKDLHRFL